MAELLTKAQKPAPRGLKAIALRLRDEQKAIRALEAQLRTARERRAKLVAKLATGNIAERAIAAIVNVDRSRVHRWKHASENGNGNGRAPVPFGTPLTPAEYHLIWQLIGEPLAASELQGQGGESVQKRSAELRTLVARGWVERDGTGIYMATSRARKAVSW
jgi:hypothetical protein